MSDGKVLFLVLCLIHLTDCLLWVGNYSVVFVSRRRGFWKEATPGCALRTSRGAPLLLNPLPPFGWSISCHLPPLSLSPKGVCSLNCQILTHSLHPMESVEAIPPFEEIRSVETRGRRTSINGREFCRCRHERQAQKLGDLLRLLTKENAKGREALIGRFWDEQFDYEAAAPLPASACGSLKFLGVLCDISFAGFFVLAPFLVHRFGLVRTIVPIAAAMVVLAFFIAAEYFIIHKRTYPSDSEDRITNLVKMILCPPASLRAGSLITENLLSGFNPIVAAHLLLSRDQFSEFSARMLRNLKYPPIQNSVAENGCEICTWQNGVLSARTLDYLRHKAHLQEDFLAPPSPDGPDVQSYCPRCLSQFTREDGDCPDCFGIGLIKFANTAAISTRGE